MRCIRCNSEIADGAKFCPYCGNPMISQQQPHRGQYHQPSQGQCQQNQGQYQLPYQGQYQQYQQGQFQQPYQGQYQQPNQNQPQQEKSQTGTILKLVEFFFYILSFADFVLGRLGIIDITGFWWSPILFGSIGAIIGQYVKQKYGITDDEK